VSEVHLNEVRPPLDGGAALRAALRRIASYRWVVFTSANGVHAFVEAATVGADGAAQQVAFAVVGPATAASLRSVGLEPSLQPPIATSAEFAKAFPPAGEQGEAVLLAVAELAGTELAATLTNKGYVVEQVVAYRTTVPVLTKAQLENAGQILERSDVVTLYSPSVVDRLCDMFGPVTLGVFCIGPSTARRAVERGLRVAGVADPHTDDGMVSLVEGLSATG